MQHRRRDASCGRVFDLHIARFAHKVLLASVVHKVVVPADEADGLTSTALPHQRTCAMVLSTGNLLFVCLMGVHISMLESLAYL